MQTICVLFGGVSPEHAISLCSAEAVLCNLSTADRTILPVGITRDGQWQLFGGTDYSELRLDTWEQNPDNRPAFLSPVRGMGLCVTEPDGSIRTIPVDVVFPVLHGENGEDGSMQGLLQVAGIPFVGCGVCASATAMDKSVTKLIAATTGVKQADWVLLTRDAFLKDPEAVCQTVCQRLAFPVFIKPCGTGSSVGVSKVKGVDTLRAALIKAFQYDAKVLAEAFIDGIEVEVAVLGNGEPVAATAGEIDAGAEFYDYDTKYVTTTSQTYIPARIPMDVMRAVQDWAVRVYQSLDCKGLSRVDFFVTRDGNEIVFNEINTLPGFTNISMYPKMFAADGVSFSALLERLIALALLGRNAQTSKVHLSAGQLYAACGQELPVADFLVTGVQTDTRTLQAGEAFLALVGERFDGHDYVQTAIEKGASMCILSKQPKESLPVPVLLVPDTLTAYGDIAAAYRQTLSARVVAVTGSSGKTTVKDMIARVLATRYRTVATVGNQNNHIGMPRTMLQIPQDTEMVVLELGMNHAGELAALTAIARPDVGVITNIGTAHIGNLGSQDAIFHAKLELLQGMPRENGTLVLNGEDAFLRQTAEIPFPRQQIFYSGLQGSEGLSLMADDLVEDAYAMTFTAHAGEASVRVTLPMAGVHNVQNALLAMQVGMVCGVSLEAAARALADFCPTALRSDRVQIGAYTVIRDYYNANPEAMRAALLALDTAAASATASAATGKRRIAVLGGMNELGAFSETAHRELGAFCRAHSDAAFFYGPAWAAFAEGYGAPCCAVADREALIAALTDTLAADCDTETVLLIKGSRGMQMERVYDALTAVLPADTETTE